MCQTTHSIPPGLSAFLKDLAGQSSFLYENKHCCITGCNAKFALSLIIILGNYKSIISVHIYGENFNPSLFHLPLPQSSICYFLSFSRDISHAFHRSQEDFMFYVLWSWSSEQELAHSKHIINNYGVNKRSPKPLFQSVQGKMATYSFSWSGSHLSTSALITAALTVTQKNLLAITHYQDYTVAQLDSRKE
jgi:hypothetical protein